MKAVIIDDETHARKSLLDVVNKYCQKVIVLAEADSVKSGVAAITKNNPDLVFLDVNMPDGTGFDILKQVDTSKLKVIFTTGYEDYAIRAFKFSALDYILKPIDPAELTAAVEKAYSAFSSGNLDMKCFAFMANTAAGEKKEGKQLVIKTTENYYLINISDIIRCEAWGNYTRFFLNDSTILVSSSNLKEYEIMLRDSGFLRIHKSHLINTSYILSLERSRNGNLILKDKQSLPVAPIRRNLLVQAIQNGNLI